MKHARALSHFALAALLAGGCGGDRSSNRPSIRGKGRATLIVVWPRTGRVIPYATSSLVVGLSIDQTAFRSVTIERPPGGTTTTETIDGLPYGTIAVTVKAYSGANGAGGVTAIGGGTTSVADGQPGSIDVNMASAIVRLAIGLPVYNVQPGAAQTLALNAFDANNAIVPLSSVSGEEPIAWTLDSTAFGSFGGAATATGAAPTFQAGAAVGTTYVTASVQVGGQGAPITASGRVSVTSANEHPESALLDAGFPTPRGLAGNVGRGSGPGAGGAVGNTVSFGAGSVTAKVVDGSGNLFAAVGTTLKAFRPDGGSLWPAPVTVVGGVKDLALTKDGRLYVVGTNLMALDAATGSPLTGFGTFSAGTGVGVAVAPNGDVIYASSSGVRALNPADRSVRWTSTVAANAAPAVAADGVVYVRTGGVAALDGATGSTIRTISVPGSAMGTVGVQNGTLVVVGYTVTGGVRFGVDTRRYSATLRAFDRATGVELWNKPLSTNSTSLGSFGFAFTSDGGVVVNGPDSVYSLTAGGAERATWSLGNSYTNTPPSVSADDTIYYADSPYDSGTGKYSLRLNAYSPTGAAKSWAPRTIIATGYVFTLSGTSAIGPDGKVYVGIYGFPSAGYVYSVR